MSDKILTGVKDVDKKILQNLEDTDFMKAPNICSLNDYIKSICDDDTFWMNRFILKGYKLDKLNKIKGDLSYKRLYEFIKLGKTSDGLKYCIPLDNLSLYKMILKNKNVLNKDVLLNFAASKNAKNIIMFELFNKNLDTKLQNLHDHVADIAKSMSPEIYDYFSSLNFKITGLYIAGLIERIKEVENVEKEIERVLEDVDLNDEEVREMFSNIVGNIDFKKLSKFTSERNKKVFKFLLTKKIVTKGEFLDHLYETVPEWFREFIN